MINKWLRSCCNWFFYSDPHCLIVDTHCSGSDLHYQTIGNRCSNTDLRCRVCSKRFLIGSVHWLSRGTGFMNHGNHCFSYDHHLPAHDHHCLFRSLHCLTLRHHFKAAQCHCLILSCICCLPGHQCLIRCFQKLIPDLQCWPWSQRCRGQDDHFKKACLHCFKQSLHWFSKNNHNDEANLGLPVIGVNREKEWVLIWKITKKCEFLFKHYLYICLWSRCKFFRRWNDKRKEKREFRRTRKGELVDWIVLSFYFMMVF